MWLISYAEKQILSHEQRQSEYPQGPLFHAQPSSDSLARTPLWSHANAVPPSSGVILTSQGQRLSLTWGFLLATQLRVGQEGACALSTNKTHVTSQHSKETEASI